MIWLGAAALATLLLYLLRPPARRISVPSTLLWKRLVERTRKRRRWLRWLLSLLLSMLFVLLLVATLFRFEPRFGSVTDPVILIDNTGSMGTRIDVGSEETRLDRALSLARTLLEQSSGAMTVADLAGTFGPTTFDSLDEASRALDRIRWRPELPSRLPALFLRHDLSEERTVYLLTDRAQSWSAELTQVADRGGLVATTSDRWSLVDVSSPAENVGFTTLSASPLHGDALGSGLDSAFLEILNGGATRQSARLQVDVLSPQRLDDDPSPPVRLLERDLDIAPDTTWTGVLDLSRAYALAAERPEDRPLVLRAMITSEGADQQPTDDVAWLVLQDGVVAIDGSRRAEVRRWPRWLTRVIETSDRLQVVSRPASGAVRILSAVPPTDATRSRCLVLGPTAEAAEIRLEGAELQLPHKSPIRLPWTAVAIEGEPEQSPESGTDAEPATESSAPWLVGRPADSAAAGVTLVSGPDPATGCVQWRFDPSAAHLETRPEFPALAEQVLLALGTQSTATVESPSRDRLQVWTDQGWSTTASAPAGSALLRDEMGMRAARPLGPSISRVVGDERSAREDRQASRGIESVEPDAISGRSGSPWPGRAVLLALLALIVVFEAGTRLVGWTE